MKPSDIIEKAYRSKKYRAWARDVDLSKCARLCFVIDGMRISYDDMVDARLAVRDSIEGNLFLVDYLVARRTIAWQSRDSVYTPNPALRRLAMIHWRNLVKQLREEGR